jgi:hypothetical protein
MRTHQWKAQHFLVEEARKRGTSADATVSVSVFVYVSEGGRQTHSLDSAARLVAMLHTDPTTYANINAPVIMHTDATKRSASDWAGWHTAETHTQNKIHRQTSG